MLEQFYLRIVVLAFYNHPHKASTTTSIDISSIRCSTNGLTVISAVSLPLIRSVSYTLSTLPAKQPVKAAMVDFDYPSDCTTSWSPSRMSSTHLKRVRRPNQ